MFKEKTLGVIYKFTAAIFSGVFAAYSLLLLYPNIFIHLLILAALLTLAALGMWFGWQKESDLARASLLFSLPAFLIAVWVFFVIVLPGQNVLYRYTFEPGAPPSDCWRTRLDENGQPLGEAVSLTSRASYWSGLLTPLGNSALRLDVNLQDPPSAGQTSRAQADAAAKANPLCPGSWRIPDEGRIQTWVCLPYAAQDDNVSLNAELFLQFSHNNQTYWNRSAAVRLPPGEWTLVRWDQDATWRAWSAEYPHSNPIAVGLEVKFDPASPAKTYSGPIYLDEFVISQARAPYNGFMPEGQFQKTGGCP